MTGLCLVVGPGAPGGAGAAVAALANGAADARGCVAVAARGCGVRYWPLDGPPAGPGLMVLAQVGHTNTGRYRACTAASLIGPSLIGP